MKSMGVFSTMKRWIERNHIWSHTIGISIIILIGGVSVCFNASFIYSLIPLLLLLVFFDALQFYVGNYICDAAMTILKGILLWLLVDNAHAAYMTIRDTAWWKFIEMHLASVRYSVPEIISVCSFAGLLNMAGFFRATPVRESTWNVYDQRQLKVYRQYMTLMFSIFMFSMIVHIHSFSSYVGIIGGVATIMWFLCDVALFRAPFSNEALHRRITNYLDRVTTLPLHGKDMNTNAFEYCKYIVDAIPPLFVVNVGADELNNKLLVIDNYSNSILTLISETSYSHESNIKTGLTSAMYMHFMLGFSCAYVAKAIEWSAYRARISQTWNILKKCCEKEVKLSASCQYGFLCGATYFSYLRYNSSSAREIMQTVQVLSKTFLEGAVPLPFHYKDIVAGMRLQLGERYSKDNDYFKHLKQKQKSIPSSEWSEEHYRGLFTRITLL